MTMDMHMDKKLDFLDMDPKPVLIQKDQLLMKLGQRTPIDSRDSRPLDLFKIGNNWDWIC